MKNLKLKIRVSTKDAFHSAMLVAKNEVFINNDQVIEEINGIKIIHCNEIIWGSNGIIACSGKIGFFTDCIYVDDYFFMLPKFVREFIIYHELGHLKNNHNSKISNIQTHNIKRLFKLNLMELEADRYAYDMLGKEKSIEALNYLIESVDLGIMSNKEFKKRLKEIKTL